MQKFKHAVKITGELGRFEKIERTVGKKNLTRQLPGLKKSEKMKKVFLL